VKKSTLKKEIDSYIEKLPMEQQQQVLEFVRALDIIQSTGTPISRLKKHIGKIPREDLAKMAEAIEDGCEKVHPGEW